MNNTSTHQQPLQTSKEQTINNFDFHDFADDTNFEQFIDQIIEEIKDPIDNVYPRYYDDDSMVNHENTYMNQFLFPTTNDEEVEAAAIGFNNTISGINSDPNLILNPDPELWMDFLVVEEGNNVGYSYSSDTTQTTSKGEKSDGTTRIIRSERKRRGNMKEKLYTLRSLVPNITKMDKASIIGDAISYVKELQVQANKLKSEIAELKPTDGSRRCRSLVQKPNLPTSIIYSFVNQISQKILQMDVYQVEKGGFNVSLVCNNDKGVAAALYRAFESITAFEIRNSNIATVSGRFVLTLFMNVREGRQEMMNLEVIKLWLNEALLNHGFDYNTM